MDSQVFKRFVKNKATIIGSAVLLVFLTMAVLGSALCTYDPNAIDLANVYQHPSAKHLLGTDNLGRDTLARLVIGARISLLVSFVGTIAGSIIGVFLILFPDSYFAQNFLPSKTYVYGLAVLLIVYGLFRAWRVYQKFKDDDDDEYSYYDEKEQ